MWNKLIQRLFLFCIALFLSLTFSLNHAIAQSVPFYWEFINVDIAVQNNGDMLVSETQRYTFTGDYKNQRYRYISLDKADKITDVSVSENNQTLTSDTGIDNNQFWIRWSHQLKAPESHTFVLKYRVVGGLQVDANSNDAQVYWKAIISDRKAAIKQAKVRVVLSEKVISKIDNSVSFGVAANVLKVDAKTVEFVAQASIEPQQELEVQVTFNRIGTDIKTPLWQSSDSSSTPSQKFFVALVCVILWFCNGWTLFLGLILATWLDTALRQPSQATKHHPDLNTYEIAFLAGGNKRMIMTAITSLVQKDYVEVVKKKLYSLITLKTVITLKKTILREEIDNIANPVERAVAQDIWAKKEVPKSIFTNNSKIKKFFYRSIEMEDIIRSRLQQFGVLVSDAQAFKVNLYPSLILFFIPGLGLCTISVAISRTYPLLPLLILILLFMLLCFLLFVGKLAKPCSSVYGDVVLHSLKSRSQHLLNANRSHRNLALAIALFGEKVLKASNGLADLGEIFPSPSGSSGGSEGGGGGGGEGGGGGGEGGGG